MEVAASNYAASLLASLNLQRERAQFCDCVVRQRQSSGPLHPAHRCVLAASSPVLASILSSTGALVELQAPCLSDSVLALLLDYIYTGALPYPSSKHQKCNLLTAACYLQMDELQEALRALQQTEGKAAGNTNASTGAENQPHEDIKNTTVNTFRHYQPLSPEREDQQYSANVDTCDDIDPCRSSSKNGANHCSKKDASTLSDASACCCISESSANIGNCRQVPQDLTQNIHSTAEVHRVSGADKEVQKYQFHSSQSAGTVKPETWQRSTEEELERTAENRRSSGLCTAEVQEEEMSGAEEAQRLCLTVRSKAEEMQTNRKEEHKPLIHHSPLLCLPTSHLKDNASPSECSSFSSPPHPCCGAVPVIRHSSKAAMLQLSEVSPMPPYHPVSQASASFSRAPDSQSGSTDCDSIVECNTIRHKNHYGAQSQNYRNNRDHTGTQSWDCKDSSDQSDILKQDYNSSNADNLIQNGEHMSRLSHITAHNDHHANCDSLRNKNDTKHFRDDSVPQNKDYCSNLARRLKNKTDLSSDDFSSKHQRLDCSGCQNVWMTPAAEEQSICSQDPKAVVPLPVQDSDTGSDSCCEDLYPEGEAKEEHSYSRCPAQTERQDSRCNLHRAETNTKAAASGQHEHDSHSRDTGMTDKRHSVDVCQPISSTPGSCLNSGTGGISGFERHTSVELEKMPGTENTEPHFTFALPVDHNMSDPTCSVVWPSYRGHLQYHCLPQGETHLSDGYSGLKHSHPAHTDHSDQSSEEEEVGTFASPGYSPLRQHFATRTTDQVLLLDISAKPAELLVANAFGQKEIFGSGFGNSDTEQWNERTSVAGVDTKSWGGENVEDKKSVGKDQSRPGAEVIHKAGVVEGVSSPKEGENKTTTLTVSSPSCVPDSVRASVSSTLSVCIPSTMPTSMPTNVSAHLTHRVHHPFQCSLCERSFSQRGSLNRHVRSHLGVRPFPCPRCPMTFSRQYRVTEHMRVHQRYVLGSDVKKPPPSSI